MSALRDFLGSSQLFRVARARGWARLSTRKPTPDWTVERVPSNRLELDRALCLTDRLFFSAKPSVKYRNLREVRKILGFVALFGFHFLARGCKRGLRLLLIAARTRNQSVSPILRVKIES